MDTIVTHTHLRVLWDYLTRFTLSLTPAQEYSSACSSPLKACHSCVLTLDAPSQAQPISPPVNAAGKSQYSYYVDFQSRIYQIYWTNTLQHPNLSRFPTIDGTAHLVMLSDKMAKVWAASKLLNYGTDGCIRCLHLEPLPIIKIAHPNRLSRLRVQHEFEMLKEMKHCSLPIPSFGHEPLIDDEGIFGYRMELLFPIDFSDVSAVSEDLKAIVSRVHDCGFSHGDLNPSNVMRNSSGSLVLIDPSFSGPNGRLVPDHIPSSQYKGTTFCTTTDEEYLKMFFGCTTKEG